MKKTHWNYRIGTQIIPPPPGGFLKERYPDGWRIFKIIECHYEDDIPSAYAEKDVLKDWDTIEDIEWTVKKLTEMLDRNSPILDLDNWPNHWVDATLQ